MKYLILFLGGLTIIITLLTAYYTYNNKNTKVYICAGIASLLSMASLFFTQMKQDADDKENEKLKVMLDERTQQLQGYATGGDGNKPLMLIHIFKEEDGSYTSTFRVDNYGKFPFSNIYYEITDTYTATCNYIKEHHLPRFGAMSTEQIMDLNKYNYEHQELKQISGNIPNLPKNVCKPVYRGKIDSEMPIVSYMVNIYWNNQIYIAFYEFERARNTTDFKLVSLRITDDNGKQVPDLKVFFPLIPDAMWEGFATKIDTINQQ